MSHSIDSLIKGLGIQGIESLEDLKKLAEKADGGDKNAMAMLKKILEALGMDKKDLDMKEDEGTEPQEPGGSHGAH